MVPVNFYIALVGGYEILLGMDVMVPRRVGLDFNENTFRMSKEQVPGDDYLQCKKIPMRVEKQARKKLSFVKHCWLSEEPDWVGFPQEGALQRVNDQQVDMRPIFTPPSLQVMGVQTLEGKEAQKVEEPMSCEGEWLKVAASGLQPVQSCEEVLEEESTRQA